MPKRIVDPKTGAVIIQLSPEEREAEKLKKRVKALEHKVERLEILIKQLTDKEWLKCMLS